MNSVKENEEFKKLSWMVDYLSNKVFNLDKISYEKEDLQQELRIKLYQSMRDYRIKSKKIKMKCSMSTYCYTCLLNINNDIIRKIKRRDDVSYVSIENEIEVGYDELGVDVEMDRGKMELIIDGYDVLSVVNKDKNKRIFLDYVYGYSQKEIASIHCVKLQNVKNVIFKIKNKIKEKYTISENFYNFKSLYNNSIENINIGSSLSSGVKNYTTRKVKKEYKYILS